MVNNSIHYTQYKMNLYIYDEFNNICVYLCGAFIKNVDFEKADILEFTYNLNVDYYSILDDISKISDLKNILRLMKLKKLLNESLQIN